MTISQTDRVKTVLVDVSKKVAIEYIRLLIEYYKINALEDRQLAKNAGVGKLRDASLASASAWEAAANGAKELIDMIKRKAI